MNVASVLPFPNRHPHCSSIPKVLMCSVSLVAMIDDITLAMILPRAMPRHLFGFERSPVLGRMQSPKRVNTSGLYSLSFQYFRIISRNSIEPSPSPKFLNASVGIPFGPGGFRMPFLIVHD